MKAITSPLAAASAGVLAESTVRRLSRVFLMSGFFALLLSAAPSAFAEKTAVQSGDWNHGSTWGGGVPAFTEEIVIPAGIAVFISPGAQVLTGSDGTMHLRISGKLSVYGTLISARMIVNSGGSVVVNKSASMILSVFVNNGSVTNAGGITANGLTWSYGQFLNDTGATLDNRSSFIITGNNGAFTNRGTVINNYSMSIAATAENHGTIRNVAGREFVTSRDFKNRAGGSIVNDGVFKSTCCEISNAGTIANGGSFENNGRLVNSCTGSVTGAAIAGNQPTLDCVAGASAPAPAPAPDSVVVPTWANINPKASLVGISAGSATLIAASDITMLYEWLPTNSTFSPAPILGIRQSSMAADGTWWSVGYDGYVRRRVTGPLWAKVAGALKQVSVGSAANIWGVTPTSDAVSWNGTGWTKRAAGIRNIAAAADGTVWGVGSDGGIMRWNGATFVRMPGAAVQVSVGNAANVWTVNSAGVVSKWNGTAWDAAADAGICKEVAAASDGTVLVIRASDRKAYRRQ